MLSRRLISSPSTRQIRNRSWSSTSYTSHRRITPTHTTTTASKSNNKSNQQQRIASSSPVTTTRGKATTTTTTTTTSRIANAVVSRIISRQQQQSSSSSTKGNNLLPLELVTSPQIQRALPYIGHGAYMALVSGFCMTDMLSLRLALVGGYTGLVAFHSLHPHPLKIPLGWSAVFILVNAGAAITLAYDQFGAPLTVDEELLYEEHFANTLTRGQFYQLIKLGTAHELTNSQTLTKEGQYCDKLYFLVEGKANVYHHQKFVSNIHAGGFINDVAFVATSTSNSSSANNNDTAADTEVEDVVGFGGGGGPNTSTYGAYGAYGTVITSPNCKLISWNANELKDHLKSRKDFDRNMKYTLTQHLMQALLNQRETNYEKQKTKRRYHTRNRNINNGTTLGGGEGEQHQQVGASAVMKEPLGYFIIEDEQQQQQQQHQHDHNSANIMIR